MPVTDREALEPVSYTHLDAYKRQGHARLQDCFDSTDRSELVATFLAVLELVKSGRLYLNEENTEIYFNQDRVKHHAD